jgi:hypothetical protein
MSKFRKHDREQARREAEANREAASSLHPIHTPGWHAEYAIRKLQDVANLGLMDCYESFERSLADLYPDLPWNPEGMAEAVRLILADGRFPAIRDQILALHGFDLGAELEAALREQGAG